MEEYLDEMSADMDRTIEALGGELSKVRTGRASPKLVQDLQVNVSSYGAVMPLNQLATIQAPDARLLVVSPWDKSTLGDVEKAIIAANLGLTPQNDGQIIRLPVPPLTAERRTELVRVVRHIGEEHKVRVRHVRREYNDLFKGAQRDGDISEDDARRYTARVQEATDAAVKRVDEAISEKEAEVQEV